MTDFAAAIVPENAQRILIWSGVLVLLVVVLSLGVWYYRRRWLSTVDSTSAAPWTFDDLRKMRDQGALTEQEYQSLRSTLLGAYGAGQAKTAANATPASTGGSGTEAPVFDVQKGPFGGR